MTPNADFKLRASRKAGIKYQGAMLRPCVGLDEWIRWGEYYFDLRPVRRYLGLPVWEKPEWLNKTQDGFRGRMVDLCTAVGSRDFHALLLEVNETIEVKTLSKNLGDDLPF